MKRYVGAIAQAVLALWGERCIVAVEMVWVGGGGGGLQSQ